MNVYSGLVKGDKFMTEKRFLSFVLTEGLLLLVLGICMLMLPKITTITFGLMLCLAFIIYGGYKVINSFLTRNYTRHFVLNMLIGLLLIAAGVFLFMAPMFSLVLITSIIGVYFIAESISSTAFAIQNRKTLYFWWADIFVSVMQFIIGLIIIAGLPSTALWIVGVLAGINFLISGAVMISMYISTKYVYS